MNATTKTTGILSSLQWEPTTDCQLDTAVGDSIASYCKDAGIECPADEAFQSAKWSVPVGTTIEQPEWAGYFGRVSAPALRVEFANGTSFALLIGWSDACGCETCQGLPSLRVVEVRQ